MSNAWRVWLEEHWDDLAAALESARDQREAELRDSAGALLPALLKDERAYQDKLFKNRLKELDEERGEKGRDAAAPPDREAGGDRPVSSRSIPSFGTSARKSCASSGSSSKGRSTGASRSVALGCATRIEREREHLLDEVLPRRFSLARCALTPVAVALLVPEGTNAVTAVKHEWWGELRHGGMLVAPQFLDELIPELPELDEHGYDRLRSAWLRLDAALYGGGDLDEARREFVGQLLEGFLGLDGWQKASSVADEFKATSITGEALRPNWVLPDPDGDGALLAVWFDEQRHGRPGPRGSGARASSSSCCARPAVPLGLLTNGRQFRLVHAGPDYDAWAEWDAQTWFDESEGRETLRGLAALLRAESDEAPTASVR